MPSQIINYVILETMDEEGSTYGYELIKKLKKISNDYWDPSYGTIYGALNRMEKNDLIERANKGKEDRKYYCLTEKGKGELKKRESEIKEMGEQAQDMVLGFLNVYENIYGKKDFKTLIEKMRKELDV